MDEKEIERKKSEIEKMTDAEIRETIDRLRPETKVYLRPDNDLGSYVSNTSNYERDYVELLKQTLEERQKERERLDGLEEASRNFTRSEHAKEIFSTAEAIYKKTHPIRYLTKMLIDANRRHYYNFINNYYNNPPIEKESFEYSGGGYGAR